MWHKLIGSTSLFLLLLEIDRELASQTQEGMCKACGGVLHEGRYRRKGRGEPKGLGAEYGVRFSFCCGVEGCRKRATPPSVRFLGRRVYYGAVFVLIAAIQHGGSPARLSKLSELIGQAIDRRTLRRWSRWWREAFAQSRFFRGARGLLGNPVDAWRLPLSLLEVFRKGEGLDSIVFTLKFLLPLSVGEGLLNVTF